MSEQEKELFKQYILDGIFYLDQSDVYFSCYDFWNKNNERCYKCPFESCCGTMNNDVKKIKEDFMLTNPEYFL